MTLASLAAFAGLCLVLSVTPGPDTFLVLRIALNRPSAGIAAAAGSAGAAIVWAALVGVGLAAILEQSAELFRWIKIAGGLYLLYLGISSFIKSRKAANAGTSGDGHDAPLPYSRLSAVGAGALSTLLNPKVGLFYLAVVPQFIPHGGDTMGTSLILGVTVAVIAFAYLSMVAVVAFKAMRWLKRPKVNTVVERASSGIIAGLGVGVVASGASS
ncbi:LysE family translocator [Paenarthrobacter ureafaciens]|uniref:LysE family translocator n=1 Tax=Paenarthrobacter TaxID=1742992 RepID=UPI00074D3C70|nr:LysE family translocator [Paenarthrobacter ureafaciens]AMB41769.1 lysine transporter LysE [Arthrobacter sp. ATCC 21022]KUR64609.1 lysine transporter LysE [Arthrobacter sp. ATCC 21022]MBN9130785.1 LysE family translocator [Paenarthrobacter ureafaciens]NWL27318.1 LysE family translocator [Paenarthrobacter ureafaciens]RWW94451.1 LysE family translocator [Paenarthrobacter ureafaciens]